METKSQHIAILGAGESGIGAALLAQQQGNRVFVSDNEAIENDIKAELDTKAIPYEEGGHSIDQLLEADLIIKSPGIPKEASVIQQLRDAGIPIQGEIEYAGQFAGGTKIGITGTNGKTTTTTLLHSILNNEGLDVALAGNIGTSFSRKVAEKDFQYWVLELSSFQLEDIDSFRLTYALLLNISPDHLKRYNNSMEAYARAKFRIFENQESGDYLVYNYDDPMIRNGVHEYRPKSTLLPFSLKTRMGRGAYLENDKMTIQGMEEDNQFQMETKAMALQESHNQQNAMAAGVVARALKIRKKTIRESLQNFETLEHRLERVLDVHGITFINDSKGSNLNSLWYALESMKKPVILIAGGLDKGNDYESIKPLVKEKVKAMVCLGKDNERIKNAFEDVVPLSETQDMQEAVKLAYKYGEQGDAVLLAPACASFDLFKNFEDRGKQFKDAVYKL